MRLHQVLTGAANVADDSVAVAHGTVTGFPFTVYGSGYEVVILDSHFNRLQIISNQEVSITSIVKCIACSSDDGKVAVSFGKKVVLYQPFSVTKNSETKLPFQWKKMSILSFESKVEKLCWDQDAKRLLVGSDSLHIWRQESSFTLGEGDDELSLKWTCVWKRKLATPTKNLEFSPDGHYFASAGQKDCMVKIWFRAPRVEFDLVSPSTDSPQNVEAYNFIYILHPTTVQSFSWRKTSKHMPLCSVPNVLLTCCADNVCRIWSETVKYKPSHHDKQQQSATTKSRTESDIKHKTDGQVKAEEKLNILQRYHLVSMFHFHLAAVINPSSDIALLSMIPTSSIFGRSFQLQWLNNKEVQLTTAVEAIYASLRKITANNSTDDVTNETDPFLHVDELDGEIGYNEEVDDNNEKTLDRTFDEEDADAAKAINTKPEPSQSLSMTAVLEEKKEEASKHTSQFAGRGQINNLLHDWCSSSDTLYCIHPADGSLLIWVIDYLDDFTSAYYRQVQVSFASRIPATFSKADASSLCWTHTYHYTQSVLSTMYPLAGLSDSISRSKSSDGMKNNLFSSNRNVKSELSVLQVSYLVSAHANGSLNLWLVTFSDSGSFTGIASITHITRSCGPRFETTQIVSHPILPLIIGTSQQTHGSDSQSVANIQSELILWHASHVSPLSEFKGITEMARISSPNPSQFISISWVPVLYHHSLLSIASDSVELLPDAPCACFVAASECGLELYQILLDAKSLLSNLSVQRITPLQNDVQSLSEYINSEQSGSHSACIMKLCMLEESEHLKNIKFLHVYNKKSLLNKNISGQNGHTTNSHLHEGGSFYIVVINEEIGEQRLYVWCINVTFDGRFSVNANIQSPKSVNSDTSITSPMSPKPLVVSHCLQQKFMYDERLCDLLVSKFASSADIHCSTNLNSSCPVQYNFVGTMPDGHIRFWDLTLTRDEDIMVREFSGMKNEDVVFSGEIMCIACAGANRFGCITKAKGDTGKSIYHLHIKECESSGELVWNTEATVLVSEDCSDNFEHTVQLSWLSMGNGSYLISVALSNAVFIYSKKRVQSSGKYTCQWEILKKIEVNSGKSMLRLTITSWTSGGFFLIGVENEVQVYSQWDNNCEVKFKRTPSTSVLSEMENADAGVILTQNSFTVACNGMKNLPQYHPHHLLELLNLGKMRRVRAILRHLVRCVAGITAADAAAESGDVIAQQQSRTRARTLTKTHSNLSEYSASPTEVYFEEINDSGPDIDVVPPLKLTTLLAADKDESGIKYSELSQENAANDKATGMANSAVYYGLAQAHLLTANLSRKELPGLTSQEQMYLLTLSDTIASTKFELERTVDDTDVRPKFSQQESLDTGFSALSGGGGGYATTGATGVGSFGSELIDDCGLRFLLSVRHHMALMKSLSQRLQAAMKEKGMMSSEFCWAFHSDCKEELLAMIPGMSRNEPTWAELRAHGIGWWVRSNDLLRRTIEKVAKTHFQLKKDPIDCAIFYLAMKKKTLLCALYRSMRDAKMSAFFSNDFTQERWRKAALKNAYALLGKQRFVHAAAFFLLANALWDAVEVCVNRLGDIQLALVISRLHESNTEVHNKILRQYVLDKQFQRRDPFLGSMAHWILKEYSESLEILLVPVKTDEEHKQSGADYPAIFNFYHYLRYHPLLIRRHYTQHKGIQIADGLVQSKNHIEDLHMLERKLYFRTASSHLNSGLPDIALEVILMLPKYGEGNEALTSAEDVNKEKKQTEDMIITGTFSDFKNDNVTRLTNGYDERLNGYLVGSSSLSVGGSSAVDLNFTTNRFADLDEEYKIGIGLSDDSDSDESEKKEDVENKEDIAELSKAATTIDNVEKGGPRVKDDMFDIVALNLKYTCIIRCLIDELIALPAMCLQHNLKLRTSLNSLLEEELNFLHNYCDYGHNDNNDDKTRFNISLIQQQMEDMKKMQRSASIVSQTSFDSEGLSLGEKVEKVALHSEWLKRNQQILTCLYEHCSMVGTGDAEIPAICLELLLLLHEIEDHRVLSSPLTSISAGPSVPPLLLASMASFSLVASPTAFLQSMTHDLLQTVIDLPSLPTPKTPVTRLADLENLLCSLSSCVYHSLCGGEDDKLLASVRRGETQLVGKQLKDGKLVRLPYGCVDVDLDATSSPSQWPGVKFFLSILTASNKDGSHNIKLLLCEAAVGVYLGLLVSSCSRLACNNLYRLVQNNLTEDMWSLVFGGGTKIVVPAPDSVDKAPQKELSPKADRKHDTARMKWNYKLLGKKAPSVQHADESRKLMRHEVFIQPRMSLSDYFLRKPSSSTIFKYDSEEEESDEEGESETLDLEDTTIEDDGFVDESHIQRQEEENRKKKVKLTEHFNSSSYPWLIMQLSLVKIASVNINLFLSTAGLDISDLPTQSPQLYNATKILLRWEQLLTAILETYPERSESLIEYVPSITEDGVMRGGATLQKMKILLDSEYTPFSSRNGKAKPAKRLWHTLVQQDSLRQFFLHYAFKSTQRVGHDETDYDIISARILHKDPEPVTSFCLNKSNLNYMAVSTTHEIIEYEIAGSLDVDMFSLDEMSTVYDNDNSENKCGKASTVTVIQRRPCSGIRRMDSHSNLPYYVTGGSDGSVRMFEFVHPDQIAQFRGSGQNERVNKIQFNPLGNKFAVVDDSGYLSMWLVANTQDTAPYLTLKCHSKYCLDFAYLGSSSLIATVGFTNDKRNICVWDTLLPSKKALVHSFSHNVNGAQSLCYVPGQHCLISGGKRGDICIFDIRQRKLLHTFEAHDTIIKTITLDPSEKYFVTGSVDGDVKVWGLAVHELCESFPKEHAKATVSLRQVSPGVQCLLVLTSGQLLSCGGDGMLKCRMLQNTQSWKT
ncbi:dmX-like protein 1 [Hydractinia symbiolongicarpus]|uniref:dmX-like protein 1 n=1 Tax=Hydractinia symbiolongicarpus TaxID=13093 RepID=UPI00254BA312|nr:dmX-like protein 1 [Hydractinia symbiolongicarpus]